MKSGCVGDVFGRLTLLAIGDVRTYGKRRAVVAACRCGRVVVLCGSEVLRGKTRSCGCYRRDAHRLTHQSHGETVGRGRHSSAEYVAWGSMKERCAAVHGKDAKNYRGRGIAVCERWLKYKNFLEDMGRKPSPLHSLDRMDNDRGYIAGHGPGFGPGNCRWATREEQSMNRRNTIAVSVNGARASLAGACRALGLGACDMSYHFRRIGVWALYGVAI